MVYEVVSLLLLGASVVMNTIALVFICRLVRWSQNPTVKVREIQDIRKAVDESRHTI
jgi:hypothetical protein